MSEKIKVMLVDDSAVVRGLMQRALAADAGIEVVATAMDGQMALDMLSRKAADVIILDIEMPGMDGISALPLLIKASPQTRIIMSSTLTMRNAEISLKALALGASDYLAKPTAREPGEVEEFYRQMISKIRALAPANNRAPAAAPVAAHTAPSVAKAVSLQPLPAAVLPASMLVKQTSIPPTAAALAIASSTGGPQALLEIFKHFKGQKLRTPIFITQHMPPNFTTILAQHIQNVSGLDCHEAVEGEEAKAGVIYIAPGDFHMTAERVGTSVKMHLDKNPQENYCRPSADPMLRSLSKIYGNKLLVAVLTGLGSDGARGASEVVRTGGLVVAQDEATSVVYGMPKAVVEAKLTSAVFPLGQIAPYLIKAIS